MKYISPLPNDLKDFHVSRYSRFRIWADRHDRPMFVAACCIVLIAFALSGCATVYESGPRPMDFYQGHDPARIAIPINSQLPPLQLKHWTRVHPASTKPWMYVRIPEASQVCQAGGAGSTAVACTHWEPDNCIIVLTLDATAASVADEERHCDGWVHD